MSDDFFNLPIILASSSPRRKELLQKIKIIPDLIISPDIDETPFKNEDPQKLAIRLAFGKAKKVADSFDKAIVIAADTVCVSKGIILDKTRTEEDVRHHLNIFSGGRLRVHTGVCIIHKINHNIQIKKKISNNIIEI